MSYRARWWAGLILVALLVALLPMVLSGSEFGTDLPQVHGGTDPLAQCAQLGQALRFLPHEAAFWDAPWFWPQPMAQAFLDPMVGPSLIGRAVPGARDMPARAYQWVMIFTLGSTVVATAWGARRFGLDQSTALLAAVVFTAGPYATGHWHHLNQIPAPWLPLGLVAAHELLNSAHRWRWAALLVASVALQLSWSLYASAALLVGALLMACVSGWKQPIAWRPIAVASLSVAAIVIIAAIPFRDAMQSVEGYGRDPDEVLAMQARVFDLWKAPAPRLLPWPTHDPLRPSLYPGLIWSALAVWGLWRERKLRVVRALALVGVVGLLLAFGRSLVIPWTSVEFPLPFAALQDLFWPLRALRDPSRFAILSFFALSVLGAMGARRLVLCRRSLGLVIILLALVDLAPGQAQRIRAEIGAEDAGLVAALSRLPADAAWFGVPAPCDETRESALDARWMLFALASDRPVAGGASGFVPPVTERLREACCREVGVVCLDQLRATGIGWIVSPSDARLDAVVAYTDSRWTLWSIDADSLLSAPAGR